MQSGSSTSSAACACACWETGSSSAWPGGSPTSWGGPTPSTPSTSALTQLQADALVTLDPEMADAVKGLVTVAPVTALSA